MARNAFTRLVSLVFDREAADRMQEEAKASLGAAGNEGAEAFEKAMAEGGRNAARALVTNLRRQYDATIAQAKINLAKGLIDPRQFAEIEVAAKRMFNEGLLQGMERLRAEGKTTEAQLNSLGLKLKDVGKQGEDGSSRASKALDWLRGKALAAAAAVAGIFAINAIRSFVQESMRMAIEAELSAKRIEAVWRATGGAVGFTVDELLRFSKTVQRETLFDDDEVETAIAQLLTYKTIVGDTFQRTIRLGADLSSVFGGLAQSTQALARALDDPIAGLDALRRQGFTFEEQVKSQIKTLTEQGRILEAQVLILDTLEGEVGGVSREMKTGMAGALDAVNKGWKEFREALGNALLDASEGPSIVEQVSTSLQGLTHWLDENRAAIKAWGDTFMTVFGWIGKNFDAIAQMNKLFRGTDPATLRTLEQMGMGDERPVLAPIVVDPGDLPARKAAAEARVRQEAAAAARAAKEAKRMEEEAQKAEARVKKMWERLERWTFSKEAYDRVTNLAVPVTGPEIQNRGGAASRRVLQAPEIEEVGRFQLAYEAMLANVETVSEQVAYNISAAFEDAFLLMRKEAATFGNFAEGMLRGLGGGVLASIAQLAQQKVRENIAAAIEAGARALGFMSLGAFPSASAAGKAAAGHIAAATAWGALSGGAGAGRAVVTGGAGAFAHGQRDPGLSIVQRSQPAAMRVEINVSGVDPNNPAHQRVVWETMRGAAERYPGGEVIINGRRQT